MAYGRIVCVWADELDDVDSRFSLLVREHELTNNA